jgi:opacity protein-like surface antigen
MRHVPFVTLAILLAAAPAAVLAQEIPSPFEHIETRHTAGAYLGYQFTGRGSLDLGPHSSMLFGGRYGMRFTGPLSGEVSISLAPTQRTAYHREGGVADAPLEAVEDVRSVLFIGEAGLVFHFTGPRTWNGLAPYAVATGGLAADLSRSSAAEEAIPEVQRFSFGPALAAGIGLGTDWFLSERLSLRGEVRNRLWRLGHPEGLTETGRPEGEWTHNFGVTLGSAYHF